MNERFHLEINTFEDFIEFVRIIRNTPDLEFHKLKELTNRIKESDNKLESALELQKEK